MLSHSATLTLCLVVLFCSLAAAQPLGWGKSKGKGKVSTSSQLTSDYQPMTEQHPQANPSDAHYNVHSIPHEVPAGSTVRRVVDDPAKGSWNPFKSSSGSSHQSYFKGAFQTPSGERGTFENSENRGSGERIQIVSFPDDSSKSKVHKHNTKG